MKPLWIWTELTGTCNIKCKLCYSKVRIIKPFMSRRVFDAILDLIAAPSIIIQKLHLNWFGEPLLHPDIISFIHDLEQRDLYFPWELHTNGTMLDLGFAKKLIKTIKRGAVTISIDGGNEIAHDWNRGMGNFRKTLMSLHNLLDERKKQNKTIMLCINQLDLGIPKAEYDEEYLSLIEEVDEHKVVIPIDPHSGLRLNKLSIGDEQCGEPFDSTLKLPCFWVGNSLFIDTDGNVRVCLVSDHESGIIGNILQDSIMVILKNADTFRNTIIQNGRADIPHCAACGISEGTAYPKLLSKRSIYHG